MSLLSLFIAVFKVDHKHHTERQLVYSYIKLTSENPRTGVDFWNSYHGNLNTCIWVSGSKLMSVELDMWLEVKYHNHCDTNVPVRLYIGGQVCW